MCTIAPPDPTCKPLAATPWRYVYKRRIWHTIARHVPQYRAEGWPVEAMEAEVCYLARSQMARWRLILPDEADDT